MVIHAEKENRRTWNTKRMLRMLLPVVMVVWSGSASAAAERPVLEMREAIARGIRQNLDLAMSRIDIPIRKQELIAGEAAFDPAVEASLSAADQKLLTGVILYEDEYQLNRSVGAGAGVLKRFKTGLRSRLSLKTERTENNFLADSLDPQYRNIIVLELTQPLMRDFGTDVNTANIRVSKNQVKRAAAGVMDRAQSLGGEIERIYLELAGTAAVLEFRTQSRELAGELLAGNRRRLDRGMISVTEVDEARTAVVDRNETIIQVRQRLETLSNQLKDLMETDPSDVLYDQQINTAGISRVVLPRPERQAAVEIALNTRPDLQSIELARDNQEIMTEYFRNRKKPQMDLVASAGMNGLSGGDRPVTIFGGPRTSPLAGNYGDAYGSMIEDGGYQVSAELRFQYPIGNRSAKARYRKSRLEERKIGFLIDRTKHRIQTEIQNAFVTVDRSLERVRAGEKFIRLAEKTLAQETSRLKSGLSDTFRVLDYQEKLVTAQIRYITALIEYRKGLSHLYQAMGINLARYDILASIDEEALPLLDLEDER